MLKGLIGKSLFTFSKTPGLTSENNCDLANQLCQMGAKAAFEFPKSQENPVHKGAGLKLQHLPLVTAPPLCAEMTLTSQLLRVLLILLQDNPNVI